MKHNNLMLRSERRERLEAWAASDSPISHNQYLWTGPCFSSLREPTGRANARPMAGTATKQSEGGNWHSRNEWYRPVDAFFGPQNALLTVLVLTGLDGVTKPALQVRQAK